MQNLQNELIELLKNEDNLVVDNLLNKNKIIEAALKVEPFLIKLLIKNEIFTKYFFEEIESVLVFDKIKFQRFVNNKSFLPDSYTSFKNKIGLTFNDDNDSFIKVNKDVVLAWPYKDCILQGGQNKEDQKRDEIFWNETLSPENIDRLLDPKVFTNFKKFDKDGQKKIKEFNGNENLILKGNNLLCISSLLKTHRGKIKCIYIDPPYNPKSDANTFEYNNSFNHSTWLTFMKNRLEVAKELLSDDGIIFIDIDHYELFYLGILSDEIFGYHNRLGVLAVVHNLKGRYNEFFSPAHENKIVFAKNISKAKIKLFADDNSEDYPEEDNIGRYKLAGLQRTGDGSKRADRPNLFYPIYFDPITKLIDTNFKENFVKILPVDNNGVERRWRWGKEKVNNDWKTELVVKEVNGKHKIYSKIRIKGEKPKSVWLKKEYSGTTGTNDLKEDLGVDDKLFPYPKSVKLVKDAIQISTDKNDIILDFFGGSGTTAKAVLELNKEDGGDRKFILCEQMDYVESITSKRIQNVIKKNKSDSFVYAELCEYNQIYIDEIQKAKSKDELLSIWKKMEKKAFISYQFDKSIFNKRLKAFQTAAIEKMKYFLIEILDKNQLYVNFSEIEDISFNISNSDKDLNYSFYKNNQ